MFGKKTSADQWLLSLERLKPDIMAIDFETANSSRASACSIGVVGILSGHLVGVSTLINPEVEFSPRNIQIHGITTSEVKDSPTFPEIWNKLAPLLEGKSVVAHNAAFDLDVINKSALRYTLQVPYFKKYCTMTIGRSVWPDYSSHRLDYLCERQGIALDHHQALSDALGCAQLFIKQVLISDGVIREFGA